VVSIVVFAERADVPMVNPGDDAFAYGKRKGECCALAYTIESQDDVLD
jgi:hypothetical protein